MNVNPTVVEVSPGHESHWHGPPGPESAHPEPSGYFDARNKLVTLHRIIKMATESGLLSEDNSEKSMCAEISLCL